MADPKDMYRCPVSNCGYVYDPDPVSYTHLVFSDSAPVLSGRVVADGRRDSHEKAHGRGDEGFGDAGRDGGEGGGFHGADGMEGVHDAPVSYTHLCALRR